VRDVSFGDRLARIDYRRTKTDTDPRQVPLHSDFAHALRDHIAKYHLKQNDKLFGMFARCRISDSHERARTAIGRGTLREMTMAAKRAGTPTPSPDEIDVLRILDLPHVSAIPGRGLARLERISDWLGHADIRMARIYAGSCQRTTMMRRSSSALGTLRVRAASPSQCVEPHVNHLPGCLVGRGSTAMGTRWPS
jgi:integrase